MKSRTTLHSASAQCTASDDDSVAHHRQYLLVELPFELSAARDARRAVADALVAAPEPLLDAATLVCSELVTNALQHGSPPVLLAMEIVSGHTGAPALEVTVTDGGAASPAIKPTRSQVPPEESGRGRLIVDSLARSSSLDVGKTETRAWCHLVLDVPSPSSSMADQAQEAFPHGI